jgi:hypothetical protein
LFVIFIAEQEVKYLKTTAIVTLLILAFSNAVQAQVITTTMSHGHGTQSVESKRNEITNESALSTEAVLAVTDSTSNEGGILINSRSVGREISFTNSVNKKLLQGSLFGESYSRSISGILTIQGSGFDEDHYLQREGELYDY